MSTVLSGHYPAIYEEKYHKLQRFVLRGGLRMEEDKQDKKPKISRACLLIGNNTCIRNNVPILTFSAYYIDEMGEIETSTTKIRKCKVFYYIEDDEMKIYEPPQKNSGLNQGCIVNKGKFKKADGDYYCINDLNIGNTLFINGREYTLFNCDAFTKNFLQELGFRVKSPQPDVYDPLTKDRNEMNVPRSYRRPFAKIDKLGPFLKHHPKQLRFYGLCGEGKNLFEEQKEITLYYDLSNGMIKLIEEKRNRKGIDGASGNRILLRPTLVPKRLEPSLPIGEIGNPTLLNLAHDVQDVLIGGKYFKIYNPMSGLADSNPVEGREKHIDYYTENDLELGKPISIFCSTVILYDCDTFTRNYYRTAHNREMVPVSRPNEELIRAHKLVYKHEKFGEPEKTIRNDGPLKGKSRTIPFENFFKDDRHECNVRQLKFLALVLTDDPLEKSKVFIVSFFLEDDTLSIKDLDFDKQTETAMEHYNLKRMRVTKPQSPRENAGRCFYKPQDMYVGNVIYAKGNAFELLEADEYTYDYMEKHCDVFHVSNIKFILENLQGWVKSKCETLKSRFESKDLERIGFLNYENFRDVIYEEMSDEMKHLYPEHSIKTLARFYAGKVYVGLRVEDLISQVRTELYRKKFYDFEDLKIAFGLQDSDNYCRTGSLDADRIYFVLRTTSLPVGRDLLKSLVYKFPKVKDKINYNDLVETIDWLRNPAPYDKAEPQMIQINWEKIETSKALNRIKYNSFMMDILQPSLATL